MDSWRLGYQNLFLWGLVVGLSPKRQHFQKNRFFTGVEFCVNAVSTIEIEPILCYDEILDTYVGVPKFYFVGAKVSAIICGGSGRMLLNPGCPSILHFFLC